MTWLDDIKPYTSKIVFDKNNKHILLTHPHWSHGKSIKLYRKFLKDIKLNPFHNYTVTAIGFMSLEGLIILSRIQNYLNKLDSVESVKLNSNMSTAIYNLQVKLK